MSLEHFVNRLMKRYLRILKKKADPYLIGNTWGSSYIICDSKSQKTSQWISAFFFLRISLGIYLTTEAIGLIL